MDKWVYFDVDKSSASIGGQSGVEAFFGVPPVAVNHGLDQARALIKELTKREKTEEAHALFESTSPETKIVWNETGQQAGVRGFIFDTLSLAFRQQKRQVIGERNEEMNRGSLKAMDKRGWGLIRDDVDAFLGLLSSCAFPVVVNCHSKRGESSSGRKVLKPEIQGSAQEAMLAYPDLVAYCVTGSKAPDGHDYGWQVGKDLQHEDTKSRVHGLPDVIPQDFQLLLDAFEAQDQPNPFIMILGQAGQGKTSALRTLNANHEEISQDLGLIDFDVTLEDPEEDELAPDGEATTTSGTASSDDIFS